MSVVIEELNGPDHAPEEVQVLAPGPEAHQAHEERFHDATDASSDDDEWQDVTEHFDAATLNDQPQRQARFSDEGSDSGSSFQVVDHPEDMPSDAAAVPPVPAGHDSPATAAAPEDRRAPPTPGSEQQQQGADTVDAPPPPLLRPPDDFWDSSRPSRLPSGGFGFGNDLHSSDAPAGGHGADGARGSTQEGDEAMRVHDEDLAEGEEQPPEPVETLTEEEIKVRACFVREVGAPVVMWVPVCQHESGDLSVLAFPRQAVCHGVLQPFLCVDFPTKDMPLPLRCVSHFLSVTLCGNQRLFGMHPCTHGRHESLRMLCATKCCPHRAN